MRDMLAGAPFCFTDAGRGTDPLRRNFGLHVGDTPELVHTRRAELSEELERDVLWMNQTHSNRVEVINSASALPAMQFAGELGPVEADAVIIDARGWLQAPAIAVMTADCLPILISGVGGVLVAAIHAGRVGLLAGIIEKTIASMRALGAAPAGMKAVIGPAACGRCYEVPDDMMLDAHQIYPSIAAHTQQGTSSLDLPKVAAEIFSNAGIDVSMDFFACTIENTEFHSHRREPRSGRQIGVIVPGI